MEYGSCGIRKSIRVGLVNPSSTNYSIETESITLKQFLSDTHTFLGWYDENGELVEEISPSRLENITLTAKLIETSKINKIQYTEKLGFKTTDVITTNSFNSFCFNEKGVYYDNITCTVAGEMTVGNTISVTLSVDGVDSVTINNIKIYGTPTLESKYTDYIYFDQVIESSFKAYDTFGQPTTIQLPTGFEVGDTITVTAVDIAGNTQSKQYKVEKATTEIFIVLGDKITGLTDYGKTLSDILIPETINGLIITSIYNYAFSDNKNLTNIIFSNTIVSIADFAFQNCDNLKVVNIPASVEIIRLSAFSGCSNLETLNIEEGVLKISDKAFENCTALTNVVIPSSITTLGTDAFINCTSLKSAVILSTHITRVNCFENCTSLTTVELPSNVTTVGRFGDCVSLTDINLESVEIIETYAFEGCTSLKSVYLNSVTTIDSAAFYECSNLEIIIIPLSTQTIGTLPFNECNKLTIYCEGSAPQVGWGDYWNYTKRPVYYNFVANQIFYTLDLDSENILVTDLDKLTEDALNAYCIDKKGKLCEVTYSLSDELKAGNNVKITLSVEGNEDVEDVVLTFKIYGNPTIVTAFVDTIYSDYAISSSFKGYDSFGEELEVIIKGDVVEGGKITATTTDALGNTFETSEFTVLKSSKDVFNVSESIIAGLTEYGATLSNIFIPDAINGNLITTISNFTSVESLALQSVVIPKGIKVIYDNAFSDCPNLTIYCEAGDSQTGWAEFWNSSNCPVYYNFVPGQIGYTLEGDSIKATDIDKLTEDSLNPYYVDEKSKLCEVIYSIDDKLQDGNIVKITLTVKDNPSILKVIEVKLYGNPIIETYFVDTIYLDYAVPSSFKTYDLFGVELEVIIKGDAVEGGTIIATATDALGNTFETSEFTVLKASKDIFNVAGAMVTGLTEYGATLSNIVVPNSINGNWITTIQNFAFNGNTNLTDVTLSSSITSIWGGAFLNCSNLKSINLSSNVNYIGNNAFNGCSSLESIIIPKGVKDLYDTVFLNCTKLKIYCEASSPQPEWYEDWNPSNCPVYYNFVPGQIGYMLESESITVEELDKLTEDSLNAYYLDEEGNLCEVIYSIEGKLEAGNTVKITLTVKDNPLIEKVIEVEILPVE